MDIVINHTLSTHQLMDLFDQYGKRGIEVMVTLSKETPVKRKVGRVAEMFPQGNRFRVRLAITSKLPSRSKEGYIFSNYNGAWIVERPR